MKKLHEFMVRPNPDDPRLSVPVAGLDHEGNTIETDVVSERPLTLFLNAREIVTLMTIGDHPDLLAVGYLLNQNMLRADDEITGIDYDEDIETIVVPHRSQDRLRRKAEEESADLRLRPRHVFGDLMEEFDKVKLSRRRAAQDVVALRSDEEDQHSPEPLPESRRHPRLRALPGRLPRDLHGRRRPPQRVDKIAGYMLLNGIAPDDKIFYTTGRLTSEMVIKSVKMGIPSSCHAPASPPGASSWRRKRA